MQKSIGSGALALVAMLAACGNPEQATETKKVTESTPDTMAAMDGPFARSEMAMDQAMKSATGVDAGDSWVKKMIAHHEGAIAMSKDILGLDPRPDVASMAQDSIDKQGAEIAKLKGLARSGAGNSESARLYDGAMARMRQEMMAASGATPSDAYLAKMLAHHRGAVAMSDVALANGATGAVRAQVEKTRKDQQKEAEMVQAMLRGEPMASHSKSGSETRPPAAPDAKSGPPASKAAPSAPAPMPTKTAADPNAGHDMDKMDNM